MKSFEISITIVLFTHFFLFFSIFLSAGLLYLCSVDKSLPLPLLFAVHSTLLWNFLNGGLNPSLFILSNDFFPIFDSITFIRSHCFCFECRFYSPPFICSLPCNPCFYVFFYDHLSLIFAHPTLLYQYADKKEFENLSSPTPFPRINQKRNDQFGNL